MSNMSEIAKSMVDNLGYPYKVYAEKTPYETIVNAYKEALIRGKKEGFTPVMVPVDEILEEYFEILKDDGYSVENVLNSEMKPGKQILEDRFAEYSGDNEEDFEMNMDEFIGEFHGEAEVMNGFISLCDYYADKTLETIIFEVPTTKPWELVAYVPFGGWNDCPSPDEMMAICKYWYEKYSAVPAAITHDVLEMTVPVPVPEDMAIEVAKEHYAFTPDRVNQGTETGRLSEVAASIAVSDVWYFWWD